MLSSSSDTIGATDNYKSHNKNEKQLCQRSKSNKENRKEVYIHTNFIGKAGEDGASGAAGEPEHERVGGGAALGADEVVEEADTISLIHLHVPAHTLFNTLVPPFFFTYYQLVYF
jgi:hypothetical protein